MLLVVLSPLLLPAGSALAAVVVGAPLAVRLVVVVVVLVVLSLSLPPAGGALAAVVMGVVLFPLLPPLWHW